MPEHLAGSRQRLLDAMAHSIAEVGYQLTTVTDIVAHARTSRRTFYQHFTDREDCFVALLAATHSNAIRAISRGIDPSSPWEVQIRQAVESWIAFAEEQTPIIVSWIDQMPALGPRAQTFRDEVNEAYIRLIQSVSNTNRLRAEGYEMVERGRAVMFIGGLRELVTLTVQRGGSIRDVTNDAYDAAISLFGSSRQRGGHFPNE
jgi:AcrR family transcriptional regulator